MANTLMKRRSMSLIIREMQIKTTIRSHLTPVKMVVIHKSTNNKCTQQCGESGPSYMLIGLLIVAATVESSVEFPQKSKNGTDS